MNAVDMWDADQAAIYFVLRISIHLQVFFLSNSTKRTAYLLVLTLFRMVMLHRAGLLLDPKFLRRQLEMHCPGSHWNHRLQASEAICVSSARAIIKVLNDLVNTHGQSRLVTLTLPLLATFVLAIQSLKHPSAWLADSDLGVRSIDTCS